MAQTKATPAGTDPKSAAALGKPQRRFATFKRRSANLSESLNPDLVMLLDEPEVRLLMRADDVDEHELMEMLDAVRAQMRANPVTMQHDQAQNSGDYRPGVGIVLLNQRGEVFIGRRIDVQNDAWQMPQGGIDDGETPRQAAVRELKEEIGTDNADIIAESRDWLFYDVPEELAQKAWAGRWKGQRQKWFVMLFKGADSDIDLATKHPEFNAWRWIPTRELTELAVAFKRRLYLNVIGEFATIFRD
jgi:putative (di)nucleoside polyphosphate hydrolase